MITLLKLTGVYVFFVSIAILIFMGMAVNYLFEKFFNWE